MPKIIQIYYFFSIVVLVCACTESPLSKEDQIRHYIDTGISAAESRSHSDLADLIDNSYRDQKSLGKTQLVKLMRAYFFRHRNIFLLTKIEAIDFPADDEAIVTLHVAMAGSVISDASVLANLRARIYRFELQLVQADSWLLREASWQIASMVDMQ